LVSFFDYPAQGATFQLLNFTGALGLVYNSWQKHDVQPVVLNIVFSLIAFVALFSILVN